MKTIRVVAAIICDNMSAPSRIFATARGYGEFKGQWEFPGGKIEAGNLQRMHFIEKSEKNWIPKLKSEISFVRLNMIIRRSIFRWTAFLQKYGKVNWCSKRLRRPGGLPKVNYMRYSGFRRTFR